MPQKKPCIDYAYYYLSRFPKTEKELRAKLYEKGYTDVEVESAMELLIRDGYVDDEQFARMYLESEVIKKGKPLWTIRGKLLQKGIDNRLLEWLIAEYEDDIADGTLTGILKEIDKLKARGLDGFDIAQKLIRKGYKIQQIKKALAKREEEE